MAEHYYAKSRFTIHGIGRWALAHGLRREPDVNAYPLIQGDQFPTNHEMWFSYESQIQLWSLLFRSSLYFEEKTMIRVCTILFCVFSITIVIPLRATAEIPDDDGTRQIGRQIDNFTLRDFRGKTHSLEEFQEDFLVVAFLGTECPLAKLYGPRLAELAGEFKDHSVGFVGINSNAQDSITEVAAYARRHGIAFPILKDVGNQVADQFGAVRTPEVFVLDRDRKVRYWGRIDDQYGIGYVRDAPRRRDLHIALTELVAGGDVTRPAEMSVGCHIGRVKQPQADSEVTYSNQIARILQKRCVECHRTGDIAPFDLTEYDEVVGWAEMIGEVVEEQRMPPWHASPEVGHFANDRRLTEDEKSLIYAWIEAGAPEGDPSDLPPPVEYVSGWQLTAEPDQVNYIQDEPFEVKAEGAIEYKYFRIDPGFQTDKWIKGVEVLPGNRAVVHHILVFTDSGEGSAQEFGGGVRGFLAGYVPGVRGAMFPEGMAKRIPAGAKLVFQVHYTPVGSVQHDRSKIGFVFADPEEVTYEVKTMGVFQPHIRIPPNEDNHREVTKSRIKKPVRLLALSPHMHLRGKSFRYQVQLPGQADWTTVLDIPSYDFNWQTNYQLAEPLELPADTYIKCVAAYDNSEENLNNPDPNKSVRWGDQTWDEMLIGYLDVAQEVGRDKRGQPEEASEGGKWRAEEFLLQLDKDDDNRLSENELPPRLRRIFKLADADKDEVLNTDEVYTAFRMFLR